MNRFQPLPVALLLFIVITSIACAPTPCASDGDCDAASVCLIDAEGARCTGTSLAMRRLAGAADHTPVDDGNVDVDIEVDVEGIVIRQASTAMAPSARAGAIVMRPVSVVVTRPAGPSNSQRSNP